MGGQFNDDFWVHLFGAANRDLCSGVFVQLVRRIRAVDRRPGGAEEKGQGYWDETGSARACLQQFDKLQAHTWPIGSDCAANCGSSPQQHRLVPHGALPVRFRAACLHFVAQDPVLAPAVAAAHPETTPR